ncbi:MAG TPA: rRNA maturation RNase YbeY [Candidatus Angelobacter sp.]|nr:rRNA maturation RNase YbeY [Candidatus Angelobacter sp.]
MTELLLRNRQRVRRIDIVLLKSIARALLTEDLDVREFELGIHLVAAPEMSRINQQFLGHEGSTDVITFDHSENAADESDSRLHGELFICLDDAVAHARGFRTRWPSELVRCLVHGVLHLRGFDDSTPPARRAMKLEEERLLRELKRRFPLPRLAKTAPVAKARRSGPKSRTGNSRRGFPLSKRSGKPRVQR